MRYCLVAAVLLTCLLRSDSAEAGSGSITRVVKVAKSTWRVDGKVSSASLVEDLFTQTPGAACPEKTYENHGTEIDFTGDPFHGFFEPVGDPVSRLCLYADYELVQQADFNLQETTPTLASANLPKPTLVIKAKSSLKNAKFTLSSKETQCLSEDDDNDLPLYEYSGIKCGLKSDLTVYEGRKQVYAVNLLKNSYFDRWDCDDAGRFRWRVRYFNPIVYDPAAAFPNLSTSTITKTGKYTVPRCRPRARRFVGKGYASAVAYKNSYQDEFTSRVDCSPVGGGSRASQWLCKTTHNNTYRECTDTELYTFTKKDRYGRRDLKWTYKAKGKSCSYF